MSEVATTTELPDLDAVIAPAREQLEGLREQLTAELDARREAMAAAQENIARVDAKLAALNAEPVAPRARGRRGRSLAASRNGGPSNSERVREAITSHGPMGVGNIAEVTGLEAAQVTSALQTMRRAGKATNENGKWALA